MAPDLEEIGNGARVPNDHSGLRPAADVLEPETEATGVGIPNDRPDNESRELHLACASLKRARSNRRVPTPGDGRVQEKDGKDRSYRERDHEPRWTRLLCHA